MDLIGHMLHLDLHGLAGSGHQHLYAGIHPVASLICCFNTSGPPCSVISVASGPDPSNSAFINAITVLGRSIDSRATLSVFPLTSSYPSRLCVFGGETTTSTVPTFPTELGSKSQCGS